MDKDNQPVGSSLINPWERVGIDLVSISRIQKLLESGRESAFCKRLLTPQEQMDYPHLARLERRAEWLAGRWAAKEAALKVLGTGLAEAVSWQNLCVVREALGAVHMEVYLDSEGEGQKQTLALSITHEAGLAMACCLGIPAGRKPLTQEKFRRSIMYPYIDGNVGYHIAGQHLEKPVRFLSPTGIRLMARQGDKIVYEVIRIEGHCPLFWQEHMERMKRSAQAAGLVFPGEAIWLNLAKQLYQAEPRTQANLRLVLGEGVVWAHYSQSYYPSVEEQSEGVATAILDWEREEPQVKCIRPEYKAAVAEKIGGEGPDGPIFEVLLRDRQDVLTEGSRSNFFWIKEDCVYSPPAGRILLGITRKALLETLSQMGLRLSESLPTWEQVKAEGDWGAFLTASPIDILPIRSIEGVKLISPMETRLPALQKAYHKLLMERGAAHTLLGSTDA